MKYTYGILLLLQIWATILYSQNESPYQATQGIYVDMHLGLGPSVDDDAVLIGLDLSAGYQKSKWVGIGGNLCTYAEVDYYSSSFTGLGLHYRIRPSRRWVLSMGSGFLINHQQGYSCRLIAEPGLYNYFNFHVGRKLGSAFTLGCGFVGVPGTSYEREVLSNDPICSVPASQTYVFPTSGVKFTIGIHFN